MYRENEMATPGSIIGCTMELGKKELEKIGWDQFIELRKSQAEESGHISL